MYDLRDYLPTGHAHFQQCGIMNQCTVEKSKYPRHSLLSTYKSTSYVIQGVTLLTESLVLQKVICCYFAFYFKIPFPEQLYYSNFWDP